MIGAHLSRFDVGRWGVRAATLFGLWLGLGAAIGPAAADKVGVAAAVNPDAFSSLAGSPQSQLNIGKSIFFNERINTTGKGLVQVLLLDGSTFTVGPGSDLVIDKFVYDPKKGTGQIAASFSKGVMRFVGGKISKNEGGVTVDTPAGALAIRGGVVWSDFKSSKSYSVLFVFGKYVKLQGQTIWQPGYGFFNQNGRLETRPFSPADINSIMAALTNGNQGGLGNKPSDGPNPSTVFKLVNTQSLNQLISDANTTQITGEAQKELDTQQTDTTDQPQPPPCDVDCEGTPPGHLQGYAGGLYQQNVNEGENEPPVGVLANRKSEDVDFAFNEDKETFSAQFNLRVGEPGDDKGGANILFGDRTSPPNISNPPSTSNQYISDQSYEDGYDDRFSYISEDGGLLAVSPPDGVTILNDEDDEATPGEGPTVFALASSEFFGQGENQNERPDFCSDCDFLKWGVVVGEAHFVDSSGGPGGGSSQRDVTLLGWWVAGDIPAVGDLPFRGSATYSGDAIGTVWTDLYYDPNSGTANSGYTYTATGDMDMTWDFGQRSGNLTISHFDEDHFQGGLTFSGKMCAPGVTSCGPSTPSGNHFGGQLSGQLPTSWKNSGEVVSGEFPSGESRDASGFALGSFARGPSNYDANGNPIQGSTPQGVMGNWAVNNDHYKASGVFAGTHVVPTQ